MLLSIFRYIKGYLKIRVIGYSPERFLNACSHRGIYIWGITPVHGSYDMYVSVAGFRKLKPVIRKTGAKVVITERIGLPFYLFHYRKRRIFFAGAVAGIALIYILSLFVWSIDVRGNQKYTDEALITFLEQQGVTHGMRLSRVDCDRIVKDIRRSYDEIIWVSASIEGCRLIVQIKENEDSRDIISTQNEVNEARDIVADHDGMITKMIVRKGLPCVREGDQVQKGQVLVTGIVPVTDDAGETVSYQYQKAEADIRAQVVMEYQNGCRWEYDKKEHLSQKIEESYFKIGNYLIWAGGVGNKFEHWDEMTSETRLHIGKYFYLPVSWGCRVTTPYLIEQAEYKEEEIQNILSEEYCRFADILEKKGVEIIENDVKIYTEPLQAEARGTLTVITDIGTEEPAGIAEDVTDGDD